MPAHHHDGAAAPGPAAPKRARVHPAGLNERKKDEGPGAGSAEAFKGQTEPNAPDSPQVAPGMQPEGDAQACTKRFATLQAQLALRGVALSRIEGTSSPATYTVARWNLSRELATLDDVATFAIRVGVPA